MTFYGRFEAPLFGNAIPVAGRGTLEIDDHGIHLRSYRARSIVGRVLAVFVRLARTEPVEARYPWRDVGQMRVDGQRAIVCVRNAGNLCFCPVDGPGALLEMIDVARTSKRGRAQVTRIAA